MKREKHTNNERKTMEKWDKLKKMWRIKERTKEMWILNKEWKVWSQTDKGKKSCYDVGMNGRKIKYKKRNWE